MLSKPRFKSCYQVSAIAPDQVFFLSERGSVCLQDPFLYLVASLVDGDRSLVDDIKSYYKAHYTNINASYRLTIKLRRAGNR
jgi:hypothetical protein